MKTLLQIRQELRALVEEKQRASALVLPSDRDQAMGSLNFMAGQVLACGGAEAVLRLVEEAMNSGRDW